MYFLESAVIVTPIGNSRDKYERPRPDESGRDHSLALIYDCLFYNYVCRTGSFLAFAHRVLDLLPLVEVGIPLCLDFRVVNEQVRAAVVSDYKSVSFSAIEPFYCS
jgi:hypothetical protein